MTVDASHGPIGSARAPETVTVSHYGHRQADENASALVQSAIISVFADIAMGLGAAAVAPVLPRMLEAVTFFLNVAVGDGSVEYGDTDDAEALRLALSESFTGLCQTLEEQPELFAEFLNPILSLLDVQANLREILTDNELRTGIGLIGDIADKYANTPLQSCLGRPSFRVLIQLGRFSPSSMTRDTTEWTASVLPE